jgi:hypothetical protein
VSEERVGLVPVALAPGLAALLSILYLIGWCRLSDLSFRQTAEVLFSERESAAVLIFLDAGRAATMAAAALLSLSVRSGTFSPWFWLVVGFSSFFVGFRFPHITLTETPRQSPADEPRERRRAQTAPEDTGLLLYSPNVGMFTKLRRKSAGRLEAAVSGIRGHEVAVEFDEVQRLTEMLFPDGADPGDVLRITAQCRKYVSSQGESIAHRVRDELNDYFDTIELDVVISDNTRRTRGKHKETVYAILFKLQKHDLRALQRQVLYTTQELHGREDKHLEPPAVPPRGARASFGPDPGKRIRADKWTAD